MCLREQHAYRQCQVRKWTRKRHFFHLDINEGNLFLLISFCPELYLETQVFLWIMEIVTRYDTADGKSTDYHIPMSSSVSLENFPSYLILKWCATVAIVTQMNYADIFIQNSHGILQNHGSLNSSCDGTSYMYCTFCDM